MLNIVRTWGWEIAAMISSIACTLTIIAILGVYDGRPVFMLFDGITLNTIIALLSTMSKTTLLFVLASTIGQQKWILFSRNARPLMDAYVIDEASRGPLGSLWAIWRMRRSLLTTIGAVCTVLTLAIDPFTQQLIQYELAPLSSPRNDVTVPRAQRFSKGMDDVREWSMYGTNNLTEAALRQTANATFSGDSAMGYVAADATIQSATFYGLVKPLDQIRQQLPVKCSTGNCTFPIFKSLAVCSKCTDVTDQLTMSPDRALTSTALSRIKTSSVFSNGTRIELSSRLWITNMDGTNSYGPVYMASFGTGNRSETLRFKDMDTLIWSMTIIRARNNTKGEFDWPNVPVTGTECAIHYCVNDYDTKIINGTVIETVTEDLSAKRSNNSWQALPSSPWKWSGPVTDSLEYDPVFSHIKRTDLSIGDGFNVSQAAVDSISNFFQNYFSRIDMKQRIPQPLNRVNGYYIHFETHAEFAPTALQTLVDVPSLEDMFYRITTSVSNAIRSGADGEILQSGYLVALETRFKMVLPWIALHICLALLGLIDLTLTVLMTHRERLLPWKSHFFAAMSWGSMEGSFTRAYSTRVMEEIAQEKEVLLPSFALDDTDSSALLISGSQRGARKEGHASSDHVAPSSISYPQFDHGHWPRR